MIVYGIVMSYSNGEPDWLDEHYGYNTTIKFFTTKEKALAYIASLKPKDMKDYEPILEGWEEVPTSELSRYVIRSFRRNIYSDIYESFEYRIVEWEVEE